MYKPKNFKSNNLVKIPEGYLNGQSCGDLAPMKYGSTTVDNAGCGPLAVYNAMLYLGKPTTLPEVLRELEIYAAPIGARFGTSAILMMIYFFRHKIKFRIVRRIKKIDQSNACVLLYWTKRPVFSGSHFVFFKKDEDGRLLVYNRYSNDRDVHVYDSVGDFVPQKRICYGFAIKNKVFGEVKETE